MIYLLCRSLPWTNTTYTEQTDTSRNKYVRLAIPYTYEGIKRITNQGITFSRKGQGMGAYQSHIQTEIGGLLRGGGAIYGLSEARDDFHVACIKCAVMRVSSSRGGQLGSKAGDLRF